MLTVAIATIVVLTVASLALLFWPEPAAAPAPDDVEGSPPGDAHPSDDEGVTGER